jgi:hypothetical protein
MWLVGATIAACGTTVYIELGTVSLLFSLLSISAQPLTGLRLQGIPRSGGEKNYLEFIYRSPKFMITCAYTAYTLILVRVIYSCVNSPS